MRRASLLIGATLAGCAPVPGPLPPAPSRIAQSLPAAILDVHNRERRAFGSSPLAWDPAIAAQSAIYARELAQLGRLHHSSKAFRPGQGENLWMGTRNAYPYAVMAGAWAAEKRLYRPGRFPAVSTTRNWATVGHFTQMVWPSTNRLGCGIASGVRWDVLVCRYAPAGNVDGVMLAPLQAASRNGSSSSSISIAGAGLIVGTGETQRDEATISPRPR